MAPYMAPKSVRLGHNKNKDYLSKLPHETLLQIAKSVSTKDILHLRLTCRNVTPVCSEMLKERIKTLYIHPTSLKRATDIAAHPVFGHQIEEVVLLGQPRFREIEKAYPGYRDIGTNLLAAEVNIARDPVDDYSELAEWNSRFRAWPMCFPGREDLSMNEGEKISDCILMFERTYAPLIDALVQLPNLHKLGFAEHVSDDKKDTSFNRTRQTTIEAHANKAATFPVHLQGTTKRKREAMKSLPYRRSDANILYGLLFNPMLRFTSFSQQAELPFLESESYMGLNKPKKMPNWNLRRISFFTNLELHIDCGWDYSAKHKYYAGMIANSRTTLESLRIVLHGNASMEKAGMEDTIEDILPRQPLPVLKHLEIEATPAAFEDSKKYKVISAARHQRPSCQLIEDIDTLRRHSANLTHVSFKNIVFDTYDMTTLPVRYNVAETTRRVVSMLKATTTQKESVEWTVPCHHHHPRCKCKDDEDGPSCRKFECGVYNRAGIVLSTREDIEAVAGQLGVEMDSETRVWDFGKAFMRLA